MTDDDIFMAVRPFASAPPRVDLPAEGVLIVVVTLDDGREFSHEVTGASGEDPAALQRRLPEARAAAFRAAWDALVGAGMI